VKNALARFRKAASFIAGLLIGFSIVAFAFAMMIVDPSDWDTLWVLGAPLALTLGIGLQVVVTTRPRHPCTPDPRLGLAPIGLTELSYER
jgi:hypothetical protein